MHILMKVLEQRRFQHRIRARVDRVQAFIDWRLEGQHHHSILHLSGIFSSYRIKTYFYIPWDATRDLNYLLCCFTSVWLPFSLFLYSFVPLKSLLRPVQRQTWWLGLDHKLFRPKMAFHSWISFFWGTLNLSASNGSQSNGKDGQQGIVRSAI